MQNPTFAIVAGGMLSGIYFAGSTTATAPTKLALNRPGQSCICWQYVKHRVPAYPENYSAQDLELFAFKQAGFKRYNQPVPGAIALYQTGVLGADPLGGHVEIVESVDAAGIPMIATSGKSVPRTFGDAGCPNVTRYKDARIVSPHSGVSYWRKS